MITDRDLLRIADGLSVLAECVDGPHLSQSDRAAIAVHGLVHELGLVAVLRAIRNGADAVLDVEEDEGNIEALQEFMNAMGNAMNAVQR